MPYDHHHGGGPDRNDPQHEPIEVVVAATLDALGALAKAKGLCLDCTAMQLAGSSVALFMLQEGVVNHETGEVHVGRMEALMQAVMDVAMKHAAQTVEGYKARKAREG